MVTERTRIARRGSVAACFPKIKKAPGRSLNRGGGAIEMGRIVENAQILFDSLVGHSVRLLNIHWHVVHREMIRCINFVGRAVEEEPAKRNQAGDFC